MTSMTRRTFGWLLAMAITCSAGAQDTTVESASGATAIQDTAADDFLQPFRAAAVERWEKEITKLEALDASETDPADAILFLGSSSIRRWATIGRDMTPYRSIQRGYGGAKYSDVAVYADRLIHPHQYRGVAIFVGNDVSGKPTDHTPDQVEQFVRHTLGISQSHQPDAPVLLIEVTPTEKRWAVWAEIRQVNARLREIALSTPNVYFIPTASHFLRPDGTPRSELFVEDKLHLNEKGYEIWGNLIRRRFDEVFRLAVTATVPEPAAAAGE